MAAGKVGHGAGIRHLVDIGVLLQPPTYANLTYIRAQSLQFPCSECVDGYNAMSSIAVFPITVV